MVAHNNHRRITTVPRTKEPKRRAALGRLACAKYLCTAAALCAELICTESDEGGGGGGGGCVALQDNKAVAGAERREDSCLARRRTCAATATCLLARQTICNNAPLWLAIAPSIARPLAAAALRCRCCRRRSLKHEKRRRFLLLLLAPCRAPTRRTCRLSVCLFVCLTCKGEPKQSNQWHAYTCSSGARKSSHASRRVRFYALPSPQSVGRLGATDAASPLSLSLPSLRQKGNEEPLHKRVA